MRTIFWASLYALVAAQAIHATTYDWANNGTGTLLWEVNADWIPSTAFPVAGDTAIFDPTLGSTLTGNTIVNSGSNRSVGQLIFNANSTGFTYQMGAALNGFSINMSPSTGPALIQVMPGAQSTILSNAGYVIPAAGLNINVASGCTYNFSGALTGTNPINITGPGTVLIANHTNNTVSNATITGGGVLALNAAGSFNSINNADIINGTLQLLSSASLPHASIITLDGGTLDFNGHGNIIGLLKFNSGTYLSGGGSMGLNGGDTVTIDGVTIPNTCLVMRGNTNLSTSLIFNNTSFAINIVFDPTVGGTATIAGTIQMLGTQTFNILRGTANIDMIISSNINGLNLTKTGPGILALTEINTYTGTTFINQGTLIVNGTIGVGTEVQVNSGATLKGTGTISPPVTVFSNGTLSPGTSIGTQSYGSGLEIKSGGTLSIEVNDSSQTSVANVTGVAILDSGAQLQIVSDSSTYYNTTFPPFLTATGGVQGIFVQPLILPPNTISNLIYTSNSVQLQLQSLLNTSTMTGNNAALANYLNAFPFNYFGSAGAGLFTLTGNALNQALESISPTRNFFTTFASLNSLFTFRLFSTRQMPFHNAKLM